MIKLTKLNSLFWDNGSREKPDAVPDTKDWKVDKSEVVWTNIKISGWIILKGDWNYGYTEGQFVFLKRQSIADRESNAWNYVVIKDFWVNWLANKVSVTGYCRKTNNKELILDNIDYVTPTLQNPVRQIKLNLTEDLSKYWWDDLQIRKPIISDEDFVKTAYSKLSWYKFIKGIQENPIANTENEDSVGITLLSQLETTKEPDDWKLKIYKIVKQNFTNKTRLIQNFDLGKLDDKQLGDTFKLQGHYALNLKSASYSKFIESAKVVELDFSNLRDIQIIQGDEVTAPEFKLEDLSLTTLERDVRDIITEKDREDIKCYYTLERKTYLPYFNKINFLGSDKAPSYYGLYPQAVISKKNPAEKLLLPFINELDFNLQETDNQVKDGNFIVEDLAFPNEFGFLLFNYIKDKKYWNWWHYTGGNLEEDSEWQIVLPVLTGLKEGWNKTKLPTYLTNVNDWADEIRKKWNNFDLFCALSPYSFLSYLTILKDNNLVYKGKDWKLNSDVAVEKLLFKKDQNKITENYVENAYEKFFDEYGVFDNIELDFETEPLERGDIFFNNIRAGWKLRTEKTDDVAKVNRKNHFAENDLENITNFRDTLVAYWNNNSKKYELGIYTQFSIDHQLAEEQDILKVIETYTDLDDNYQTLGTTTKRITYNHIKPLKKFNSLNLTLKKEWQKEKFKIWAKGERGRKVLNLMDESVKEAYKKGYQDTNKIYRGWFGPKWEEKFTQDFKDDFGLKGSWLQELPKLSDGSYDLDKLFEMFDVKDKFEYKETLSTDEYKDASFIAKGYSKNTPIAEAWLDPSWWQTEEFDSWTSGGLSDLASGISNLWKNLWGAGKTIETGLATKALWNLGKNPESFLKEPFKKGSFIRGWRNAGRFVDLIEYGQKQSQVLKGLFTNGKFTQRSFHRYFGGSSSKFGIIRKGQTFIYKGKSVLGAGKYVKGNAKWLAQSLYNKGVRKTIQYGGGKVAGTIFAKGLKQAGKVGLGIFITKHLSTAEWVHKGNENTKTEEARHNNIIIKFGDGSWIWGNWTGAVKDDGTTIDGLTTPSAIHKVIVDDILELLEEEDITPESFAYDDVSNLINDLTKVKTQKDIVEALGINKIITEPELKNKEIKGKLYDLVGTNYALFIDQKERPTLIFKNTEDLKLYEEKVYRLSNEEIPSQDWIDIINQQTSLQVLTTELPLDERFIFEEDIAPAQYMTEGDELPYVYMDEYDDLLNEHLYPEGLVNRKYHSNVRENYRNWYGLDNFKVVIEKIVNEDKVSAYDHYIVNFQGTRQLLDVKLKIPKKEFAKQQTTDVLLLEELNLRHSLHLERYSLEKEERRYTERYQQRRLGYEQETLLNRKSDEIAKGSIGIIGSAIGGVIGSAVTANPIGLALGAIGVAKSGRGLYEGLRDVELGQRELRSKKEYIEADLLNKSLTLNTLHNFQEKEFQLKFLQQGNTYNVGSFNDRDIIDAYNDSRNLNAVHLIYRVPSHKQKEGLERYYQLFGVECHIPEVTIKLEELKEGDIYSFDLIEEYRNIWAVEEVEYLKQLLHNGIKILELKDDKPKLIPEVPLSWAQKVGALLQEATDDEKDILLNKLAVGVRAEELVKRLADSFVDKNRLAELILPFLNRPALIAQALDDNNLDEKTELILKALEGIDTDEVFKYLLDERSKTALVAEWLENPEDERDLVSLFIVKYKDQLIKKDKHQEIVDGHLATIEDYSTEVKLLTKDLGKLQEQLGSCTENLTNTKKELEKYKESLRKEQKQRGVLLSEISSLKSNKIENERELKDLRTNLKYNGQTIKELKDKIGLLEGKLRGLDGDLNKKKQEYSDVEQKLKEANSKIEALEDKEALKERENKDLNEELTKHREYINTLVESYKTKEKELKECDKEIKELREYLKGDKWQVEVDGHTYDKDGIRELEEKKNKAERDAIDERGKLGRKQLEFDSLKEEKENIEGELKREQEKVSALEEQLKERPESKGCGDVVYDTWKPIDYLITKKVDDKLAITAWNSEKGIWQEQSDLVIKRRDETKLLRIANRNEKFETKQYPLWSYYRNQHGNKYTITVSTFSTLDRYVNLDVPKQAHSWVGRYSVEIDKNIPYLDANGNWVKPYYFHKTKGWFDYQIPDSQVIDSYEKYKELSKNLVTDLRKELEETKKSLEAVREIAKKPKGYSWSGKFIAKLASIGFSNTYGGSYIIDSNVNSNFDLWSWSPEYLCYYKAKASQGISGRWLYTSRGDSWGGFCRGGYTVKRAGRFWKFDGDSWINSELTSAYDEVFVGHRDTFYTFYGSGIDTTKGYATYGGDWKIIINSSVANLIKIPRRLEDNEDPANLRLENPIWVTYGKNWGFYSGEQEGATKLETYADYLACIGYKWSHKLKQAIPKEVDENDWL